MKKTPLIIGFAMGVAIITANMLGILAPFKARASIISDKG